MSEEILIYILKGRLQMGENGWLKSLEVIVPVLPILQCYAHSSTTLGQCVTKIFDPDVSTNIQLPFIEVLCILLKEYIFYIYISFKIL